MRHTIFWPGLVPLTWFDHTIDFKWKESCSGSSDDNDINTDDDDDQAEKDASEYDEEQMQDHSSRKHTTSESNYFLTNEVKSWLNNFQSSA